MESQGIMSDRAGTRVPTISNVGAFSPNPLPPEPELEMSVERQVLLSRADQALARLDGACQVLPDPQMFVFMFMNKEAVLSSQIEGTRSSLLDVFDFETGRKPKHGDVGEVVNYIKAMNHGLERLKELPPSNRLFKDIHKILMADVRGGQRQPGQFRRIQNWIGPAGAAITEADFVPPPPNQVVDLMGRLEKYIHQDSTLPHLIKIALVHYQFETIHPFLDGNGRLGRMLVTFYLTWRSCLSQPVLYLSYYLKRYRQRYYDLLNKVRYEGDFESWVDFFLEGVRVTSEQAHSAAKRIIDLRQRATNALLEAGNSSPLAIKLLYHLFSWPVLSVNDVAKKFDTAYSNASRLVKLFEEFGLLREMTGQKRNRRYIFYDYFEILREGLD